MSVHHYTDVIAVKSILEFKIIRLTDIRFLNDSQEFHDGVGFVVNELSGAAEKLRFGDNKSDAIRGALIFLRDYFKEDVANTIDAAPIYVCSFSEAGNLLSQWRAYGSYAIEFDEKRLGHPLMPCIYPEDRKKAITAEAVEKHVNLLGDAVEGGLDLREQVNKFLVELVALSAIFKDSSFSEECEYRFTRPESSGVEYRVRGGILVPYVGKVIPLESVVAVHVGPVRHQDLAYVSMKSFVESITDKHNKENSDKPPHTIKVICSRIPYRES